MHDFLRKYSIISTKISKIYDFSPLIILKCAFFFFFCLNALLFPLISQNLRFSLLFAGIWTFSAIDIFKIHYYFSENWQKTRGSVTKFPIFGSNCSPFLVKSENYHLRSVIRNHHGYQETIQCYTKIGEFFVNREFCFIWINIFEKPGIF